jgi:peptidoglycan biosynthesis protein MviN/MurJ (putative lipid II flippase)
VFLAQRSALYQKGDTKRFLLNIGFTVATIIWMYGLLGGGMVITTQWNGYDFSLHMDKYIVLIACVAAVNVIYFTLEWRVYRKDKAFPPSHREENTS